MRSCREVLALFDLPVFWRLRPQLDVGNIGIAVRPIPTRRRLPVLRVLTTRGFLLAPLDESFLSFAFRGGWSGVSGHEASSAYTTRHPGTHQTWADRPPSDPRRVGSGDAREGPTRDSVSMQFSRVEQPAHGAPHLHLPKAGSPKTVDGDLRR